MIGAARKNVVIANGAMTKGAARTRRAALVLLLAGVWAGGATDRAAAQAFPGTRSVNDCTSLGEPDAVRRCVLAYQGATGTQAVGGANPYAPPQLLQPGGSQQGGGQATGGHAGGAAHAPAQSQRPVSGNAPPPRLTPQGQ